TMPDTMTVAGKTLKLSGMGLRKKAVFKVYVGGLYLEAQSSDAKAILAADGPKAMTMHFLRSIEKDKLVEAYKEGFEANAPQKAAAQKAGIEKFYSTVTDVKEGSVTTYTYAPGTGTAVNRDGKDVATIEGKEFAEVLFSLWLGPKPPSEDLQKGLLGR
ncbi:MAG TPA: chalcone isomerase family protein, partial [Thermoanaerobaculia bacterium]|nr:chalcone isomerase family protein [Thermoanaerobaculia bacterium]